MTGDVMGFSHEGASSSAVPDSLPFEIQVGRDLQHLLNVQAEMANQITWIAERHVLLQGQMTMLERLLDTINATVSRIGHAALPQEALKVAQKDSKELLERLEKEAKEAEDRIIEARGGDHPPTPEEIAAAEAENLH